ncbi:MAG: hypothetical protein ABEJ22_03665 [Haloferacaceae archaeon]
MSTDHADQSDQNVIDDVGTSLGQAASALETALRETLLYAGAAVWAFFWGVVARIHYTMGDMVSAAFTVLAFIVPVVAVALWRVSGQVGVVDGTPFSA